MMPAHPLSPLLVAESDANDMFLFTRLLKSAGAVNALHLALDGREAIRLLTPVGEKNRLVAKPAIAFIEVKLPEIGGLDVLAWIRKQRALDDLPVAIMANAATRAEIDRARTLGAQCFLAKSPREWAVMHLLSVAPRFTGRDGDGLFDLPDNLLHERGRPG